MLTWKPIKNKDGTDNKYAYEDSTKRYRIGIYRVNGEFIYQAWRGSTALHCGTSEQCKLKAYEDSLKPHIRTSAETMLAALDEIKEKLA